MTNTTNGNTAVLTGHAMPVTLGGLRKFKPPPRTDTYGICSHYKVVKAVQACIQESSFELDEAGFQLTASEKKFFGVATLFHPRYDTDEYSLSIGFGQSYNKTMALRVVLGEHVWVCSNMSFFGDVALRREHTSKFDIMDEMRRAFGELERLGDQLHVVNEAIIDKPVEDAAFAAQFFLHAVQSGALPHDRITDAYEHWHHQAHYSEPEPDIQHAASLWGLKQAVTHEWKSLSPLSLPARSRKLNGVLGHWLSPEFEPSEELALDRLPEDVISTER
jgi:hypothetical protein